MPETLKELIGRMRKRERHKHDECERRFAKFVFVQLAILLSLLIAILFWLGLGEVGL